MLFQAAALGMQDVVMYLLQHGANAEVTDAAGKMPIQDAKKYGHQHIMKMLSDAKKFMAEWTCRPGIVDIALHTQDMF